jgi:predicted transcriptional regulator
MGERKVFSTRLDQDLIKKLKHLAVDEGRALNDLLEEAIQALLKKYKKARTKK